VGGDGAASFNPGFDRVTRREVLDHSADFWAIVEHGIDVASHQHRRAVGRVHTRQIEERVIFTSNTAFGEEGGDEVTLLVQPALGLIIEHGLGGIAEESRGNGFAATVHITFGEPDGANGLNRLANFG